VTNESRTSSGTDGLRAGMPGAHCPTCAAYEQRVMSRAEAEVLPPDVVPCDKFAMSDAFREWAVAEMRKEVMGQVSSAGLDRMALLKAGKAGDVGRRGLPRAPGP
jgi:hypothetical protein